MNELSRRGLLKAGTALGLAGGLSLGAGAVAADSEVDLEKFVQPLPIPEVREPDGKRRGADYHEIPVMEFEQRVHPDLPATTFWGYDGVFPGPIIEGRRNQRLMVHFDYSRLPADHLLEVDDRIHGTEPGDYPGYDGPVPEVRAVTHFHGLNVPPESDGQADMWISPDGVEGPRFSRHVQVLPNRQPRTSSTYHDHARGISRLNNYVGLVGPYYIRSRAEDRLPLPEGDYDVPLVVTDRSFEADGSLHYPGSFVPNVAGDTAVVNGAAWPYFEVEPRRYRFRVLNPSNGRTYDLELENDDGGDVPYLHQIAAGHGFLDRVVPIGPGGDLESLVVAPFERADVVVDFSGYAGETFTVTNHAEFPFGGGHDGGMHGMDGDDDGHGGSGPHLDEIMQIRVTEERSGRDPSADPRSLRLPDRGPTPTERAARKTRHVSMRMTMDDNDLPVHLLNGRRFDDETVVEPQLGTTEVWELENNTMHTHPIHLHLVEFRVIGRGHDGTHDPHPNELGGKDVVRVNPGETVRLAVKFGDFPGQFPFHCHILEHEDHEMMRPFEVVTGRDDRE